MSSDLGDTLKLVKENSAWFFDSYVQIVSRPRARFASVEGTSKKPEDTSRIDLSPRVWTFGILNILAGTVLYGGAFEMSVPDISRTVIVTLVCWLIFSSLLHLLCRALGGHGSYGHTVSVNLQVLSVAFFVSSFVGFIAFRAFKIVSHFGWTSWRPDAESLGACLLLQLMFLVVYWTLGLRAVQRLTSWPSLVLIPFAVAIFMFLNLALFGISVVFPDIDLGKFGRT